MYKSTLNILLAKTFPEWSSTIEVTNGSMTMRIKIMRVYICMSQCYHSYESIEVAIGWFYGTSVGSSIGVHLQDTLNHLH